MLCGSPSITNNLPVPDFGPKYLPSSSTNANILSSSSTILPGLPKLGS